MGFYRCRAGRLNEKIKDAKTVALFVVEMAKGEGLDVYISYEN